MLALTVLIILSFNNCQKYDEGPGFSLLTKKARLTGEWELVEVDGEVPDPDDEKIIFTFEKDGDFSWEYDYGSYSYSYDGTWEWEDDKETIEISIEDDSQTLNIDYEILKLTNQDLWLTNDDNDQIKFEKQ